MENFQNSENGDMATSSSISNFFSVPELTENDLYHVFISFSSADSTWVHRLIHKLEDTFPSLKICTHDRDFTAGKTIIENMTNCIQRSQKMLMVLSPDFVHSRWCLFEANLSMFQDCISHKAIVPVKLKPCPMPLYLSHLPYVEAEDEQFFEKLCNRLLKNNAKETEDVLVHFQSSILYKGKHLLSLSAVNGNDQEAGGGAFSDNCVPDSLKAVVKDPEIYKEAIQLINDSPADRLSAFWAKNFIKSGLAVLIIFCMIPFTFACSDTTWWHFLHLPMSLIPIFHVAYKEHFWVRYRTEKFIQRMSRKTGEANLLLAEMSVLAGCESKSCLVFVFAPLKDCKQIFQITFGSDNELPKCMWKEAMIKYSSDYANCLSKKHFPCSNLSPPGHLVNGICFCQYVAFQINQGN
ncbi:uncharacterized protein [Dendropsophus ebraccatus]|uniref:uncharacterized protein n=1 Tax=Dendropsophus ebraccatus TaxID=150705 RepID=UPI00383155E4